MLGSDLAGHGRKARPNDGLRPIGGGGAARRVLLMPTVVWDDQHGTTVLSVLLPGDDGTSRHAYQVVWRGTVITECDTLERAADCLRRLQLGHDGPVGVVEDRQDDPVAEPVDQFAAA